MTLRAVTVSHQPILFVADDDPDALARTEAELTRSYGGDYRIVSERSASVAVAELRRLRDRGERGGARAGRRVDGGGARLGPARPGPRPAPARQAGAPDRLGRLARPADGRRDACCDGGGEGGLLRAQALAPRGGAVSPRDHRVPARVVARARRELVRARRHRRAGPAAHARDPRPPAPQRCAARPRDARLATGRGAARGRQGGRGGATRCPSSATGPSWSIRPTSEIVEAFGVDTAPAASPTTTSWSSAPARPGCPRRSTRPRRGCARS